MGAEIKIYNPDGMAKPLGKYCHVARATGETVYIAGQVGVNPDGELAGGFDAQLKQTYRNLETAVKSAGGDMSSIVRFTTYLVSREDIANFVRVREEIYPEIYPDGVYPTNTLLIIDALVNDEILVEIEAVAHV